jgi:hypothetical protein
MKREGGPGAIPEQVFQTLKIARHVAVDERDPDACFHREKILDKPILRLSIWRPIHLA